VQSEVSKRVSDLAIHQGNAGLAFSPKCVARLGDSFKAAGNRRQR